MPREAELAMQFCVSRQAVREALKVLAAKGLVQSRRRTGTRILPRASWNLLDPDVLAWHPPANFGPRLLADLGELRRLIEPAAAEFAATRGDRAVVAAIGAFWTLKGIHTEQAKLNLRVGTILGLVFSVLVAFPTGDLQGKQVAKHQPIALAAMEGRFESGPRANLTLIGQPNVAQRKIENPVQLPAVLSFIAYGTFSSNVKGLSEFPQDQWPQNIELLYYSFHIMAGLGTLMIAVMGLAVLQLWRKRLDESRAMLWVLMLAFPFPYIATTAGWAVAEFGRQPWLIYGLFRTAQGGSPLVHAGHTAFTTLGFAGIFVVLSMLFLYLIGREIAHGPSSHQA